MSLLAAGTRVPRRMLTAEKRTGSRMRMAPNQRWKDRLKTPVAYTHKEEADMAAEQKAFEQRREAYMIAREKKRNSVPDWTTEEKVRILQTTTAAAMAITEEQAVFLVSWRADAKVNGRSLERGFMPVLNLFRTMSLDDAYDLSFILRNKGRVADAKTGRLLVKLCAENGHAEAVNQVVASALRQDATTPGVLRSRDAMMALERLRDVSKTGNVRAIVMEANVARHYGKIGQAVKLYEQALELIMKEDETKPKGKYASIKDELSSPWIELAYLHVTQGQHVKAMKAYMVGLEKDDPMAYFNLARLDYYMAGNQHTSDWLYNMTKAAASGHYKAAHELGEYYANSPCPPAKQEVPFLEKLKGFAAFVNQANLNLNPKVQIHHHEQFANTPEKRIRLARYWLDIARSNFYLPANITLAELHLQHFIYPKDTLLKPLDPFGHSTDPEAVVNPLFDPAEAQAMLAEVLTACAIIAEAKSTGESNAKYLALARPWSRHEEVLEVVESQESLQDLKEQAEMIADAAGIDIASSDKMYREIPRLGFMRLHKGVRGQGLHELKEEQQGEA
ncbi:hypothetical protein E4T39_02128 [Aureobasidium subglaciale]|nr:hypothetical protein E4T39_02128 [Aureobasidium subglaciale]